MTTIAANKTSIACDRQFTHSGGIKFKGKTKIIDLKPEVAKNMFGCSRVLIGFAGNADTWCDVVMWLEDLEGPPPKCKGIEFLMLNDKGKIYHATNMKNWMEIPEPHFSIGSGMHLAVAAMTAGKSPEEAVKIAAKHDPSTGEGVKVYTL